MTIWFRALGLACLLAVESGCGSTAVRKDVHEAGWLLAETAHVELRTDLDPETAVRRARQLELSWQALAFMYQAVAPRARPPTARSVVVHFGDCREMRQALGTGVRGMVFGAPNWMSPRIAVTCEERGGHYVLLHELAHIFNAHHVPGMPVWLEEGLAAYYESLVVWNGRAILGLPRRQSGACQDHLAPGLDQLRRMSREAFYDELRDTCHYFLAWKLVHMLTGTTPERMKRFHRYLAGLRRGATDERAWVDAFGDVAAGSLSEDFDRYAYGGTLGDGWSADFPSKELPPPRIRALGRTEAHVLWLNMLLKREDPLLIRQQLDRMAEVEPDSPELLYWRAVHLDSPAAIPLLRDYLARRPGDERGWRALVSLRVKEATPRGYLGVAGKPPRALRALEQDVAQLSTRAAAPTSLNAVGWYHALRQAPAEGLPFAAKAVKREPECGGCWDTLALLFFQAGRIESAIQAQERAVSLLAERAPPETLARLRHYRAAQVSRAHPPP